MPTKQGEHCARCGAKCVKRIEEIEGKRKLVFDCPNKHGIQRMEDPPAELLPEEASLDPDADRLDDVAEAVNHGRGSHS